MVQYIEAKEHYTNKKLDSGTREGFHRLQLELACGLSYIVSDSMAR